MTTTKRILLAGLFLGTCLHAEPEGGFANATTSAHLERLAAFGIPAPGASAKWTHHPQCEDAGTSDWHLAISSALMVMTGNCWLQPGDDGKPSILPPGHVGPPVILAAGNENHPPASAASLESDVRAVIKLLEATRSPRRDRRRQIRRPARSHLVSN